MKLTVQVRYDIAHRLISRKYQPLLEEHMKKIDAFRAALYAHHYPKKYLDAMKSLPKGAFRLVTKSLTTKARGMDFDLLTIKANLDVPERGISREQPHVRRAVNLPIFDEHHDRWGNACLPCDTPEQHSEGAELVMAGKNLTDMIKSEHESLLGTLSALSTVKQLRENWPEVIDLVEDLLPEQGGRSVPAIPTKLLNERFGLPASRGEISKVRASVA